MKEGEGLQLEFNGVWSVVTEDGIVFKQLWEIVRNLKRFGDQKLNTAAVDLTFQQLAQSFVDQGYIVLCGQEVPVFPMRDVDGVLVGVEIRIGRTPPVFKTLTEEEHDILETN